MIENQKKISIIIPCYNEEKYIALLIENLLRQDYPKELTEIIFIDGRSTDATNTIIKSYQQKHSHIVLLDNPHRVVPHALNIGIRYSTGDIVIRMDAHSQYPANYWSVLVQKLIEHQADNVGGVWVTQPGADTLTAKAIVLATSHPLGIGNAGYRLGADRDKEVDTVPYGCFHRSLFDRIGMFDEQLLRNQDDEFNGRIIKNGGKIVLIPSLKITYFARENYTKLWRMFYQYGLFKPLVNRKLGAPASLRQFAPPLLVLGLVGLLLIGFILPMAWLAWCMLVAFYASLVVGVSLVLTLRSSIALYPYLLLAFPTIHFSYGLGYLTGMVRFMILRKDQSFTPDQLKHNR